MKQAIKENQIVLEFNDKTTKDEFIEWFNMDETLRRMTREMGKFGVRTISAKPEVSETGDVRYTIVHFLVRAESEK